MLAVALNYIGAEEEGFEDILMKSFDGFKMIKLKPSDEPAKGRLELCVPEDYNDLIKDIQEIQDPSGDFVELRGPKGKLLRMVRQMAFFSEEGVYEKLIIEGGDGINDFPWAFQIVLMKPPLLGRDRRKEWIRDADIVIIKDPASEDSKAYIAELEAIRPDVPVFYEKLLQNGLSPELKARLEVLFTDYLEQRERIKYILESQYMEKLISCEQARSEADKLKVSSFLFGNVCDELGFRIAKCRLACF